MSRLTFARLASLVTLASLASCSPSFHAKTCKVDGDCGSELVCGQRSGQSACVAGSEDPLRIGMSAPLTGPSQELGTEMKKGIMLAFDGQNAAGGIRGRMIELEFRDDQYQPQSAETAARDLLDVGAPSTAPARCPSTTSSVVAGDAPVSTGALVRGPNAVLALVGSVGTPTMVRSAPIAVETGSLFFGAFTGAAKVLRDDVDDALLTSRLDDGKSYELDPGKHVVRYVHDGKETTLKVVLNQGERGRLLVATFVERTGASPRKERDAVETTEPPHSESRRSTFPLVLAGVGAAGALTGGLLYAVGSSNVPDSCSMSTKECAVAPNDPTLAQAESGVRLANTGLAIGISGAVALVGGIVWYLVQPSGASDSRRGRIGGPLFTF